MNLFSRKAFLALSLFVMSAALPSWSQTAPVSFHLPISLDEPNSGSSWSRLGPDRWVERSVKYRDLNYYKVTGRITLDGVSGTVVQEEGDSDQYFIPDLESNSLWVAVRAPGEWLTKWRRMTNVSTSPAEWLVPRKPQSSRGVVPGSFVSEPQQNKRELFGNTGQEVWSRANASRTWTVQNSGRVYRTTTLGRATLNGDRGTVVAWTGGARPHHIPTSKIFIPDIGNSEMRLRYQEFRKTTWHPYSGIMFEIVPLNEGQVASAKREVARQQAQARSERAQAQSVSQKQSFIQAIRQGDLSQVRSMLRRNPGLVNSRATVKTGPYSENSFSALGAAVSHNQVEIARLLLHGGASRQFINTHLSNAVYEDKEAMVRFLVGSGAGINVKNRNGDTLLHTAVQRGSKKMAQLLKSMGADLRAENSSGYNPSEYAALGRNPVLADLLRPR